MRKPKIWWLTGIFLVALCVVTLAEEKWSESKSSHFIVYYKDAPQDFIENVLNAAEDYYRSITSDLGFTRFGSWSWDYRCKIYIYKDAEEYKKVTGQPEWSSGVTAYQEKTISTYPLAAGFFDTLLPHELGHIIFREFVGFNADVPLWMDEGVASYQERARRWGSNQKVREAIKNNMFIPLNELSRRALSSADKDTVELFYAEAASVVYYLITTFGRFKFENFCEELKSGKPFEQALASAYVRFDNLADLEKAWKGYLQNEE
ncbi:MAG: peptidase MA family metallohydrolase [Candidatus Omnitrophota bacterium]